MDFKKINLIKFIYQINDELKHEILRNRETKIKKNSMEDIAINLSELQMHEILYFLYGYYYRKYHIELFTPNFIASAFGPIEKNYEDKLLSIFQNINLTAEQEKYLKILINKLLRYSIYSLIEESQLTDPWKNNFIKNKLNNIPTKEINKYFEYF